MPLDQINWPTVEIDETTALLIRARSFIERGWCRWTQARDADGVGIDPISERAVEWCAYGALVAAGLRNGEYKGHSAVCRLIVAIGDDSIGSFNNEQETVEPILAAFDRAIAAGG